MQFSPNGDLRKKSAEFVALKPKTWLLCSRKSCVALAAVERRNILAGKHLVTHPYPLPA